MATIEVVTVHEETGEWRSFAVEGHIEHTPIIPASWYQPAEGGDEVVVDSIIETTPGTEMAPVSVALLESLCDWRRDVEDPITRADGYESVVRAACQMDVAG